jgi:2-C-methyl-D-erythritol 4-phosphate cytidylyltransferase
MTNSIVYAIILSGGAGNRFGNDLPKQFADIYGKTILDYCISNFNNHPLINKIIVVSNPEHIDRTKQIALSGKFPKVVAVVDGGSTRGESSYMGLKKLAALESNTENIKVLIQDAVRPNTNKTIINEVIEELANSNAVSVAIPTTDTIYIADENNLLESIPDRKRLFKAQTPQGFNYDLIMAAYEKLEKVNRFKQTDDCSLIYKVFPEQKISIIQGHVNNIKITFLEDIEYLRQILNQKS